MMIASQSPASTNAWMSEICLLSSSAASETRNSEISPEALRTSTCCCIVMNPVTRHGLETEALEKQSFLPPSFAYCAVSTNSGSIACSHGWSAGPSGTAERCASWRS
ncbi:hypothetical protein ASE15_12585 [Oerskovia sp. Root22]|nr:hypothetical protein ASE15_12585 [Oerskovia sp. Root22]